MLLQYILLEQFNRVVIAHLVHGGRASHQALPKNVRCSISIKSKEGIIKDAKIFKRVFSECGVGRFFANRLFASTIMER